GPAAPAPVARTGRIFLVGSRGTCESASPDLCSDRSGTGGGGGAKRGAGGRAANAEAPGGCGGGGRDASSLLRRVRRGVAARGADLPLLVGVDLPEVRRRAP